MTLPSVVLAIGGFDGSGGAGTLADARAIQLNGAYPCSVVTAITAQNTTRVDQVEPVSNELLRRQFACLVDDLQIDAIKIGLLPSLACVRTVIDWLSTGQLDCPIVVDPVMSATSGDQLVDEQATDALIEGLVPISTLITPNVDETRRLTNQFIDNIEDMIEAGNQLVRMGCQNVLVKGGHLDVKKGTDVWCYKEGYEVFEPIDRHQGTVRGTGCMLSSAIACYLGQGDSLREAIQAAKTFVSQAISEQYSFGSGTPLTTVGIRDFIT